MSEELKPCPFCGASDVDAAFVRGRDAGGDAVISAGCYKCGATGPMVGGFAGTGYEKSSAAWNARHNPAGYVPLPVVPTKELLDALIMHSGEDGEDARERYEALITVAKNTITQS